ncbi:hypothetical protein J2Z76_002714 [Sedimentibacter acidaminivorans]|uniref:Uncharacterized protein n=1 Tax=Sedimentibacter acidaminivorans TaxID=913099 RepID=A0ABS4GGR0_9FIRM|nr:tape measure protein [Sedimentibacter acidaminivorans]MBP1926844.1 hypothetical protein [Sedimentibacter acidaminivorans]
MGAKGFVTNVIIGGKINSSLKQAFGNFNKTTDKSTKSVDKLNSSLGSFQKKIVGLATGYMVKKAFTAISSTALDSAASMEQYRITLNTVLKDSQKAGETLKWATNFANVTPFETDEIVGASVKLESYGLTAKKYLPIIGDMAAVMGKDAMQATEAIADAQTGELERLKEFGITKEMIVEQSYKRLAGIEVVNNQGQITNQRAFNAALLSLMKEKFDGGMEAQSKTFKGRVSTIVGTMKSGLGQIAGMSADGEIVNGSAFDIISKKAGQLAGTMERMQANGSFERIQQNVGLIAGKIMDGIDRVLPKIVNLTDYIVKNGDKIVSIGLKIGKAYLGIKGFSIFKQGAISAISFGKDTKKVFGDVKKAIDKIPRDSIGKGVDIATKGLVNGIDKVWSLGGKAITGVVKGFKMLPSVAKGAFGLVGKAATFMISPMGLTVAAIAGVAIAGYMLYKNWDKVKEKLGVICGAIGDGFKGVANSMIGAVNWAINGINGINVTIPDWVPDWIGGGKTFGFSIPTIPTFANGGFTSTPSIFGEAGPEAAIPIKHGNARSLSLLGKTAQLLGVNPANEQGITIVYSPVINGGNVSEIKKMLETDYEKFKAFMSQYLSEEGRLSYEPNVLPI